jgi:ribosomal protein L37AE/L43A
VSNDRKKIKIISKGLIQFDDISIEIWEYNINDLPHKICPNCNEETGKQEDCWTCSNCRVIHSKKGSIEEVKRTIKDIVLTFNNDVNN